MTEQVDKQEFLAKVEAGYADFTALLASLPEEQMTVAGVNGAWSVKDNIAHVAAWQNWEAERLRTIKEGDRQPHDVIWTDEAIDESNERVYQENKSLPLSEVMALLRSSYQQLLAITQAMSQEELNTPLPIPSQALAWQTIAGNTYEHYEEHTAIIRDWLARSTK